MDKFLFFLKKVINNSHFIFNFVSFILGIFLSVKNKSNFSDEFTKVYNKCIFFEKLLNDIFSKFK